MIHIFSRKKIIQVEWLGYHREIAGWCAWPLITLPDPIKPHAIAVRVAKINRFAHTMVGSTFERNAGANNSSQRIREFGAGGICDRKNEIVRSSQKAAVCRRHSPKYSSRCGGGTRPRIRMPLRRHNAALVRIRGHRDKKKRALEISDL